MTEYEAQAKQFLADCNATMKIKYLCQTFPKWDSNLHNCYWFTIITPKGSYSSKFYDSLRNTEISNMSLADYGRKYHKRNLEDADFWERNKWTKELCKLKANAIPTEYDILACGEEYAGLRRIFTEEQMEKMREIN